MAVLCRAGQADPAGAGEPGTRSQLLLYSWFCYPRRKAQQCDVSPLFIAAPAQVLATYGNFQTLPSVDPPDWLHKECELLRTQLAESTEKVGHAAPHDPRRISLLKSGQQNSACRLLGFKRGVPQPAGGHAAPAAPGDSAG